MISRFLTVIVVVLVLMCSSCNRYIETGRNHFIQKGGEIPTPDVSYYESPQKRAGQDPNMGLAVAISGGGARAANFGIGIMLALEELNLEGDANVLNEIDYMSSVSGGGFAAGAYINSLYNHNYRQDSLPYSLQRAYQNTIRHDLQRSYLAPMLRMFFLSPKSWLTRIDEGDALEQSIDNHVLGYLKRRELNRTVKFKERRKPRSITLGDVFVKRGSSEPVLYPMHVANATNYHSMAIFPFTPDVLDCYQISGFSHRKKRLHDDEIDDPYQIPLAIGIKASGSFPVAISNTTMKSCYDKEKCFLHLIDGGIADNIGYKTALELLNTDPIPRRRAMLIVDADNEGTRPTFSTKERAASSVNVFGRLAYSSLETRYVLLRKELREVCDLYNIVPIFLGFDELIFGNYATPPQKIHIKKERERLIHLLKTDMQNISDIDMQILYELCLNVATKYTITKEEQELMVLAGRKVVDIQKAQILQLFEK